MGIRIKGMMALKLWFIGLLVPFTLIAEPIQFEIRGNAAILMNAQSGVILFENDAHSLHYPASTTKVATALYALKLSSEKLEIPITAESDSLASITQEAKRKSNHTLPGYWLEPDGMHIGIKKGEILTLRNLLEGMLIPSGNDAANVIAQALGPSIPNFLEGLNAHLKEIGCEKTNFLNPHGLHDPKHQTTAYELALIGREALKYPLFCEIVAKTRFIRPKTNKQAATTLLQSNRLIRPGPFYYSKAIGIKTGYHAKAKNTLIAASKVDGRTLIAVLLGYSERTAMFEDATKLFEKAFNQPKVRHFYLKEGPQSFSLSLPHANHPLQTYLDESLYLDFYPAEDPQAKCFLHWQSLSLPIAKDQKVGELQLVSPDGFMLKNTPLLAVAEVSIAWPHNWLAVLPSFSWLLIIGAIIIAIIILILWLPPPSSRESE